MGKYEIITYLSILKCHLYQLKSPIFAFNNCAALHALSNYCGNKLKQLLWNI